MKNKIRRIILTIIFSFVLICAKAQFVTIPDPNFVTWLNSNGFSGCLNSSDLDTTCNLLISTSFLDCSSSNISDLTGISYFNSLKYLICNGNQITTLPNLPKSLTHLECRGTLIDTLHVLPDSLVYLDCSVNFMSSLPAIPNTISELNCSANQLTSLPALPASLKTLFCYQNQLISLPALPDSLSLLACHYNMLTSLPVLPDSLKDIFCGNNLLTVLPTLPLALRQLRCQSNQLVSLPTLPNSLATLSCSNNHLTSLPISNVSVLDCSNNQLTFLPILPNYMYEIWCFNNNLSSLPALPNSLYRLLCNQNQLFTLPYLPKSLKVLDCSNNQLQSLTNLPDSMEILNISKNMNLTCIPFINKIVNYFLWDSTNITCLPNAFSYINNAVPAISLLPYCDIFNANNCTVYWNIKGLVFKDSIGNCLKDSNELIYRNIKVLLRKNDAVVQQTFTNVIGEYAFRVDTGEYTVSVDTNYISVDVICPLSWSNSISVSLIDQYHDNVDFALQCRAGFDIGVNSVNRDSGTFRPANYVIVKVVAGDMSFFNDLHCASGVNGTVSVLISGPAQFSNVVPGSLAPTVNGDSLTYTIPDFGAINFQDDFNFIVQTDTTAQIGSQVCFNVSVLPILGDINPVNNYYSHCFNVVNSYDPNDKEVSPTSTMDTSQYWFTYTIRFQNTGNAPAQHIYLLDTLDNNIDESSIQLLAFSHEPIVQVNEKIVRFNFPNINLPDSVNDEPNSHGYVQYKVKRKDNLPLGTQIRNTAYIYFDFNAPVVTNTTLNQLSVIVGIASNNKADVQFSIYPNPLASGNTLNLFFNSTSSLKATFNIYELSGRNVYSSIISSSTQSQQISLPDLAQGVYQCVVDGAGGSAHQKLVIVH